MKGMIFEAPRGANPDEIYHWALETTEKLNRLDISSDNDKTKQKKEEK